MSAFTEYQLENGEVEVYASTNKYMAFAIARMDSQFTRFRDSQEGISAWLDYLLPVELRSLRYLPAERMMWAWVNLFFSHRSRGGLIPIEANWSHAKFYVPIRILFRVGLEFQTDLDNSIISDDLWQAFADNNIMLPQGATVIGDNPQWQILEQGVQKYLIRNEQGDGTYEHVLNIYAQRESTGILFSVGLEFQTDLDNHVISEDLRQMIANNDIPLFLDATVEGQDPQWLITEQGDVTYVIRKEQDQLNVYAQGKWVVPFPSKDDNDVRATSFGVVETKGTSAIKSLYLMYEFLTWFPADHRLELDGRTLREHCIEWADAFRQSNDSWNVYGHFKRPSMLYNYVHTGPPSGVPPDTDDFAMQLRFALEGIPDCWYVLAQDYGMVARVFVHLGKVLRDAADGVEDVDRAEGYEVFASTINDWLWNARHDYDTYLMPSEVTPRGPLLRRLVA